MEKNFFRTGYVMVSRTLLLSMFEHHGAADSDEEAFLRMLVHVNYRDAELERPSGRRITCLRGESVIAFATWQRILGWSRGRVMRFFNNCFRDGSVEHVEDGYCRSHVRIPDYDVWMGACRLTGEGKRIADEAFEHFMDVYSEITRTPRINVGRAYRIWKKLSQHERQLALENIEDYYNSLPDVHYCAQAATYLSDKAFLNRYDY